MSVKCCGECGDEAICAPALRELTVWGDPHLGSQRQCTGYECVKGVCETKRVPGQVGGEQVWCEQSKPHALREAQAELGPERRTWGAKPLG